MTIIRLVAAIGLGLFLTWLAKLWNSQFTSIYIAAPIWIGACLLIAAIYDRRERLRREG